MQEVCCPHLRRHHHQAHAANNSVAFVKAQPIRMRSESAGGPIMRQYVETPMQFNTEHMKYLLFHTHTYRY